MEAEIQPSQPVHFRLADEIDWPAVVRIYNEVVANTTATFEEQPRTVEEMSLLFAEKARLGIPLLLAECGGEIVGYGTYGPFRRGSGYKTTVEHSLHISPGFRGRGIGTEILRRLVSHARQQGYHVMMAGIDSANAPSLALHEDFGFKKVGEIPQVARKFSRWLDLTLMQLTL